MNNSKSIVVISDTHGRFTKDINFWTVLDEADYIIHLGDGSNEVNQLKTIYKDKIYSVKGNCDGSSESYKIISIDNVKIIITHGHMLHVKSSLLDLLYLCKENNIKYALYGHTHDPKIDIVDGIQLINPGSLTYTNTYCYITITNNKLFAKIVNLF